MSEQSPVAIAWKTNVLIAATAFFKEQSDTNELVLDAACVAAGMYAAGDDVEFHKSERGPFVGVHVAAESPYIDTINVATGEIERHWM